LILEWKCFEEMIALNEKYFFQKSAKEE